MSTPRLYVFGTNVYSLSLNTGVKGEKVGTTGAAAKTYWYMEPEQ